MLLRRFLAVKDRALDAFDFYNRAEAGDLRQIAVEVSHRNHVASRSAVLESPRTIEPI
jgi:hypothetical protein